MPQLRWGKDLNFLGNWRWQLGRKWRGSPAFSEATTCSAGILYGCCFESQLFHFLSSFLLMHLAKQWNLVHGCGSPCYYPCGRSPGGLQPSPAPLQQLTAIWVAAIVDQSGWRISPCLTQPFKNKEKKN